jgi:hypothetical protein
VHKESQPTEQLEEVIQEIIALMLRLAVEVVNEEKQAKDNLQE